MELTCDENKPNVKHHFEALVISAAKLDTRSNDVIVIQMREPNPKHNNWSLTIQLQQSRQQIFNTTNLTTNLPILKLQTTIAKTPISK